MLASQPLWSCLAYTAFLLNPMFYTSHGSVLPAMAHAALCTSTDRSALHACT